MPRNWKFKLRQSLKMALQNGILPCVYRFWRVVYSRRKMDLIVFADAHHESMPPSMEHLHQRLEEKGFELTDFIHNYATIPQMKAAWLSVKFMRIYARAKYVFICDNFLPVSACAKSDKTTVVQLWHACGLMKKMGYDTTEDIPAGYRGQVYRNYDLVTVSSPGCVEPMRKAMGLPEGVLQPIGVSRTDVYFDESWQQECRKAFYQAYPQAKGKKIILWAPTFRGNAADPRQVGLEAIQRLEQELGQDYFVIRKVHPHVDTRYHLSNCSIQTERLLPVTDLLITDYSTVLTEFLMFEKPYVLFAPDREEYMKVRGFYLPYDSFAPCIVTEEEMLAQGVRQTLENPDLDWIRRCRQFHVSACDGRATDRLLANLNL